MAAIFTEEVFQEAWTELDDPQIQEGWELFTDTMGVKLYRRYDQVTSLYEYKVFGTLSNCLPEVCADVYMDLAYRKQWDSYVKELHEKDYDGQKAIYWEVNPSVRVRAGAQGWEVDGRKIWVVLAKSCSVSQCPEKSGIIRVMDYKQSLAIESDGDKGTKVFMTYFDNPGGNIPTWVVNWAAKTGVPGFLKDMQNACDKYANYCKNRK